MALPYEQTTIYKQLPSHADLNRLEKVIQDQKETANFYESNVKKTENEFNRIKSNYETLQRESQRKIDTIQSYRSLKEKEMQRHIMNYNIAQQLGKLRSGLSRNLMSNKIKKTQKQLKQLEQTQSGVFDRTNRQLSGYENQLSQKQQQVQNADYNYRNFLQQYNKTIDKYNQIRENVISGYAKAIGGYTKYQKRGEPYSSKEMYKLYGTLSTPMYAQDPTAPVTYASIYDRRHYTPYTETTIPTTKAKLEQYKPTTQYQPKYTPARFTKSERTYVGYAFDTKTPITKYNLRHTPDYRWDEKRQQSYFVDQTKYYPKEYQQHKRFKQSYDLYQKKGILPQQYVEKQGLTILPQSQFVPKKMPLTKFKGNIVQRIESQTNQYLLTLNQGYKKAFKGTKKQEAFFQKQPTYHLSNLYPSFYDKNVIQRFSQMTGLPKRKVYDVLNKTTITLKHTDKYGGATPWFKDTIYLNINMSYKGNKPKKIITHELLHKMQMESANVKRALELKPKFKYSKYVESKMPITTNKQVYQLIQSMTPTQRGESYLPKKYFNVRSNMYMEFQADLEDDKLHELANKRSKQGVEGLTSQEINFLRKKAKKEVQKDLKKQLYTPEINTDYRTGKIITHMEKNYQMPWPGRAVQEATAPVTYSSIYDRPTYSPMTTYATKAPIPTSFKGYEQFEMPKQTEPRYTKETDFYRGGPRYTPPKNVPLDYDIKYQKLKGFRDYDEMLEGTYDTARKGMPETLHTLYAVPLGMAKTGGEIVSSAIPLSEERKTGRTSFDWTETPEHYWLYKNPLAQIGHFGMDVGHAGSALWYENIGRPGYKAITGTDPVEYVGYRPGFAQTNIGKQVTYIQQDPAKRWGETIGGLAIWHIGAKGLGKTGSIIKDKVTTYPKMVELNRTNVVNVRTHPTKLPTKGKNGSQTFYFKQKGEIKHGILNKIGPKENLKYEVPLEVELTPYQANLASLRIKNLIELARKSKKESARIDYGVQAEALILELQQKYHGKIKTGKAKISEKWIRTQEWNLKKTLPKQEFEVGIDPYGVILREPKGISKASIKKGILPEQPGFGTIPYPRKLGGRLPGQQVKAQRGVRTTLVEHSPEGKSRHFKGDVTEDLTMTTLKKGESTIQKSDIIATPKGITPKQVKKAIKVIADKEYYLINKQMFSDLAHGGHKAWGVYAPLAKFIPQLYTKHGIKELARITHTSEAGVKHALRNMKLEVDWSLQRPAGQYIPNTNTLKLNPRMFRRAEGKTKHMKELSEILTHEVIHGIQFQANLPKRYFIESLTHLPNIVKLRAKKGVLEAKIAKEQKRIDRIYEDLYKKHGDELYHTAKWNKEIRKLRTLRMKEDFLNSQIDYAQYRALPWEVQAWKKQKIATEAVLKRQKKKEITRLDPRQSRTKYIMEDKPATRQNIGAATAKQHGISQTEVQLLMSGKQPPLSGAFYLLSERIGQQFSQKPTIKTKPGFITKTDLEQRLKAGEITKQELKILEKQLENTRALQKQKQKDETITKPRQVEIPKEVTTPITTPITGTSYITTPYQPTIQIPKEEIVELTRMKPKQYTPTLVKYQKTGIGMPGLTGFPLSTKIIMAGAIPQPGQGKGFNPVLKYKKQMKIIQESYDTREQAIERAKEIVDHTKYTKATTAQGNPGRNMRYTGRYKPKKFYKNRLNEFVERKQFMYDKPKEKDFFKTLRMIKG